MGYVAILCIMGLMFQACSPVNFVFIALRHSIKGSPAAFSCLLGLMFQASSPSPTSSSPCTTT